MAGTCCFCFSQKFGITLITVAMIIEALIMFKFGLDSINRGEIISFVGWGIFTADLMCIISLVKAIMNDTR